MSKFSELIDLAITINDNEIIKQAYIYKELGILTDDLHISLHGNSLNIELLEDVINHLMKWNHYYFRKNPLEIVVEDCHPDLQEYVKWFILFFGYLESNRLAGTFTHEAVDPDDEIKAVFNSKWVTYPFNLDAMKFINWKISVTHRFAIIEKPKRGRRKAVKVDQGSLI